ncbi:fibronectin type III domain-containing protein [Prosthecobacter sp.]|uniref:fibronectin type III domain-containing protein n=1 Tax=Prosthecobacter sp. TaxID=1965333 RepID=UPI002AB9AF87|nr:fibronectin type III domain-containing protein [Prosthecobacter sp.]MDZ4405920.1 fibronectin type III domain-containing protein [Prosthecobacter sp.]
MAANPTPTNDSVLLARCHDLIKGCEALEEEIGIKQNTAAAMQAAWDAANAALMEVGRVKTERGQRRKELRNRDREGEVVIGRCRLRLTALFGTGFNTQWGAAGFPDRSTMVPEVFAKRMSLLSSLTRYFELKPEHESTDMGATAVICGATFEALSDARSAVNFNKSALRTAVLAKNKALKKLRHKMRGLIWELGILLTASDPRWLRFHLQMPARLSLPPPVEQVTLEATGQGKVFVQWPPAPHATRYRVQMQRMGAAEFTAAATVHEPEAWLQDLPPGEFIEVRIIAANKAGEAAPSPASVVVVR